MPVLAVPFREVNYGRIKELSDDGYRPETIACIIHDETHGQVQCTASEVSGYLKLNAAASKQMLITRKTMKSLRKSPSDPVPA